MVFSRASVTRGEKEGQVLDSVQAAEGAVQPGEYVPIVVQGLAQVRVAKNETVTPGQRLKAGDAAGQAGALRSTTVNGLVVTEGVPVIGVVLDTPDPTSGLAPVMVTLR